MNSPTLRKKLHDWHNQSSRALRSLPGFGNVPAYNAGYFGPLSNFFGDMDRIFDHAWRAFGMPVQGFTPLGVSMFHPNVNIVSGNKDYTITVELPGLEEKDVRLNISEDGLLVISGEKRQETTEGRGEAQCVECSYGAFERVLSLPDDVDKEGIEARFKNGILTVTCPRTETERSQSRQIPLSGGQENSRAANAERSNTAMQNAKKAA